MKQSELRDCGCGCHMPQETLKVFQWYHRPASEGTQAVQHSLVRYAVILPKSNSIMRKEIAYTG